MARVPGAMNLLMRRVLQLAWLAIATSTLLHPAFAQSPDMVLGTESGDYKLFTPQAVVGAGGGATSLSDATPKVEAGSGDAGTASAASRGDHVHPAAGGTPTPLSDAEPAPVSRAGSAGTASAASRGDHAHGSNLPAPPNVDGGDAYLRGRLNTASFHSGTLPPLASTGTPGQCVKVDARAAALEYGDCAPTVGGDVTWTALFTDVSMTRSTTTVTIAETECAKLRTPGQTVAIGWRASASDTISLGAPFLTRTVGAGVSAIFGAPEFQRSRNTPQSVRLLVTPSGSRTACNLFAVDGQSWPATVRLSAWRLTAVGAPGPQGPPGAPGGTLSDATPKVESGSGSAGTADAASRGDHAHPARTIPKQPLSSFGTVGTSGQCAKANSSRDGLAYGDCGSPRVLSERDPVAAGTADPGNRTDVSRSDHVHPSGGGGGNATPLSDADPADLGLKKPGASSNASRADHVHSQTSFLAVGIPPKSGATGAVGVSTLAARSDHQHPAPDAGGMAQLPAPSVGTKGDLARVNAAGDAYEVADPHVAVLSGLPAITGHGGNALFVNSAATGVEWKAAGSGGSGGDSSIHWNRIGEVLSLSTTSTVTDNLSSREIDLCKNADFLAVVFRRTNTTSAVALPRQIDPLGSVTPQPFDVALFDFSGGRVGVAQFDCYGNTPRIRGDATFGNARNKMAFYVGKITGGGGGSSGPSIPTPSAAGAGEFLRVNAAGAAYELADVPTYDSDIDDIDSALGALGRVTADLEVASTETSWATNDVVGAGIAIGTAGASTAPTTGYIRDTIARPNAGWPANAIIFATLPTGSDPTAYRVLEPDVTGSVTLIDAGGSWARVNASRTDADYYRVNTAGQYDGTLTLQHRSTIVRTRYRGEVVTGELPAIPGDANNKQYALETRGDGSGVEWSNDIFSALNTNAQDIGDALERIGKVDTPGDADASKSTLAAGQVWEIKSCADKSGSRSCTAGFSAERRVNHHLVVHGTGAANATSQSFAPTGRLTQHALISGTSYDEFLIVARHVAGNPVNTHIRSCRVPGIQGDWLANASHGVTLTGEGGACKIVAPMTGNLTVTWASPLAGQKIVGDTWRLYGIDWQ